MSKTYYKVLQKDMTSACLWSSISKFRVEYKINQWVEPKVEGTKLFIFESLESAKNLAKGLSEDIYECIAENVSTPKENCPPLFYS